MITKWLNKVDQLNQHHFFWCIVASSLLLAAWMQYIQHGWINPDSVLYFEQARLFAENDWDGILKVYEWPLYGICIGIVHKLTSLGIQTSAQLLNMLFFGLATASFLQLIKLAGGNNRTWLMGTLLLFSSQYIVGDVLEMLLRDEGFWAFYLSALVFFIRYLEREKVSDAIMWQICIIIATLFRIEAILFLLFLPLICLFNQIESSTKLKTRQLLNTYSISLALGIIVAIALLTQPQLNMSHFGRLDEIFTSNLYQQFTQKLFTQAEVMSNQVLGEYLEEFAISGLLLTFLYVIASKILTATGLIGVGLALIELRSASGKMPAVVKRVFIVVSIIAAISMALIIIKVFVLSSRYAVALAWILLIFASFYLTSLSSNTSKIRRNAFVILCLILILCLIKNTLPKRDGYNYSQDAVKWVQLMNIDNKQIYYNDSRLRYYANESFIGVWSNNWEKLGTDINNNKIHQYEYLVIDFSNQDIAKADTLNNTLPNYKEIKRFYAAKNKKYCAIYQKQLMQ